MFYDQLTLWKKELRNDSFETFTAADVTRAINKEHLAPVDLLALLSPAALPYLEEMAQKAHQITLQNFGRTIQIFAPLYVANICTNKCVYCSFNIENEIVRRKLTLEEAEREGKAIAAKGIRHILVLTGESRKESGPDYIAACVERLRPVFSSIGLEVYPLKEEEYKQLYQAGVDTMTMFQEVYDEGIYASVHLGGPKRIYRNRLDAPERACNAGLSGVTLGALLGLGHWREEAFFTALHADFLMKTYPGVEVGVSAPRMRPHVGSYQPQWPINDTELVQIMLAYRLFLPRLTITLSTRESAPLRDALLPLGITKMSAGSRTSVGGYDESTETGSSQFEISDERTVEEVTKMIRSQGYQPIFSDWLDFREGCRNLG
ncbi:2-iminoacetate synthase ThiH [Desulfitobacterium sp.]|uniref:2-iminoacetate synthase ThiH n=1 Tax=Desulfitobacterium sp. TaxID=49981 RepID=UPI002BCC0EBA|nr:2-iminoacetate synthase ThiH [Desulfitobacterium sp.]HVJ49683.1 2-iminoacetate synthase ThiH [Desulfitobacterium sp.]